MRAPDADHATNAAELGAALSAQIGRWVPHDGYHLIGLDPVSGTISLHVTRHGYGMSARRVLNEEYWRTGSTLPFPALFGGPTPVAVLGTAGDVPPCSVRLHEVMRAEGLGCEMRIALTVGGLACGAMLLLRARGGSPFSDTEIARAERLAAPLAVALRRFVAGRPLRLLPYEGPPGVVIVGRDDTVKAASPGVQDWLYECLPAPDRPSGSPGPAKLDYEALLSSVCNITATARRAPDGTAVTRMFTARGWALLHAQPLCSAETAGEMVITIQTATAEALLPAVAAWYGITPREREVVRHALEGLAAKNIARRLELSQHTVNDHLGAVYRKLGVSGREELFACLRRATP
ncbi:LuxR C-terminal-related transcriptional regulator [Streptomyces mirabilis]|uniref:LuxR C-terminal-related transcriptional regulator n=1 Tax=Streptomyces mirabilis TaxID=68239 RepID=UPI00368D7679